VIPPGEMNVSLATDRSCDNRAMRRINCCSRRPGAGLRSSAVVVGLSTAMLLAGSAATSPAKASTASSRLPSGLSYLKGIGALNGVAFTSAKNGWAVGSGSRGTLILHWNGSRWAAAPIPRTARSGFLYAVAATSADNAWAVGCLYQGGWDKTLILHWNGTRWLQAPTLYATNAGVVYLQGVTATSPSDVWIVGYTGDSYSGDQTLLLHWNGKAWSQAPVYIQNGVLSAVAGSSARNIWAVGSNNGTVPLILHWHGSAWKQVHTPSAPAFTALSGVVAISKRDAWAVGSSATGIVIFHWNGNAWKRAHVPYVRGGAVLDGVGSVGRSNIWAVGYTGPKPLIMHWNGTTWKEVRTPDPPGQFTFAAVATTSADNAWAVGWNEANKYLIVHWNGKAWS
jgi:hypothetical protein